MLFVEKDPSIELETVILYENQKYISGGWAPHPKLPYSNETNEPVPSPELYELPSADYRWATNWKIEIDRKINDKSGWSYASSLKRFAVENRQAKIEKSWNDNSRRRLYSRKMRKYNKDQLDQEVIHEIQEGLQGIQRARLSLQQVFQQSPGCFSDDEINQLVSTVHEKIVNIINLIEKIQNSEMNLKVSASVNKLRSDVLKEQQAIIAATDKARSYNSSENKSKINEVNISPKSTSRIKLRQRDKDASGGGLRNSLGSRQILNSTQTAERAYPKNTDKSDVLNKSLNDLNLSSTNLNYSAPNTYNPKKATSKFDTESKDEPSRLYLERTLMEREIESKLIPVDAATLQEQLCNERSRSIENLRMTITEMNGMYENLSHLVKLQQAQYDCLESTVETTHGKAEEGLKCLQTAAKLQKNSSGCVIT